MFSLNNTTFASTGSLAGGAASLPRIPALRNITIKRKAKSGTQTAISPTSFGVFGSAADANGVAVIGSNALGLAGYFQGGVNVNATSGDGLDVSTSSPQGSAIQGTNTDTTGTGVSFGVAGYSSSPTGVGVMGSNNAPSGSAFGVSGVSSSIAGSGVYGYNNAPGGGNGVLGTSASANGIGVLGANTGGGLAGRFDGDVNVNGALAVASGIVSSSTGATGIGVLGANTGGGLAGRFDGNAAVNGSLAVANGIVSSSTGATGVGVLGANTGGGLAGRFDGNAAVNGSLAVASGIVSSSTGATGVGVLGANTGGGLAGRFDGNVNVNGALHVTGAITAGTKDFQIDDPVDPDHKYLYHASTESSEMLNVYSGNATLDDKGEAEVNLPAWFEALNADFRYQLTPIGGFAQVYIAQEIQNNRFRIAGGRPGLKVSWLVTAVRHDAWAQQHPLRVEEEKEQKNQGRYLHPRELGQREERAIR